MARDDGSDLWRLGLPSRVVSRAKGFSESPEETSFDHEDQEDVLILAERAL